MKKDRKCQALSKRTGNQCENPPLFGVPYCWHHYPKKEPFIFLVLGAFLGLALTIGYEEFRTSPEKKRIADLASSDQKAQAKQRELDAQLAHLYQTEIMHFYSQFAMCLSWTLPLGTQADTKIDSVFRHNRDFGKGIDLRAIDREIVRAIFEKYDFAKPMANYKGEPGSNSTGFNHVLGNLARFERQVQTHLEKYGSSGSSELTTRLEYAHRMAKAETDAIRLDLRMKGTLWKQTIDGLGDFLILLRDDLLLTQETYGRGVYPVLVGKVLKSATNGSIGVTWEYGG